MVEMTSQDLKKVGCEILSYLDDFCRKNDIKYYICFGTLIGAVRHKGYIPWDDDVDVCMPRADYARFIELMKKQDKYSIISMETARDYYFSFARVSDKNTRLELNGMREICNLGVFIDVFPLDNAPPETAREEWLQEFKKRRFKVGMTVPHTAKYRKYTLKTIIRILKRLPARIRLGEKNFDKYRKELEEWITQYNSTDSEQYIVAETPYRLKAVFDKKLFGDTVDMEFEGLTVKAPVGWDKLLRNLYGDYMQLPPPEKRVSQHHFKAYYK